MALARVGYLKRIICITLLATLLLGILAAPAHAGFPPSPKQLFRGMGRLGGKIMAVPGKVVTFVTKPLPNPIRGPIRVAATIALTKNLMAHKNLGPIFKGASTAQKAGQDVALISDAKSQLKDAYSSQAEQLREHASNIDEMIANIKENPEAGDIKRIVDMRQVQQELKDAADAMDARAKGVSDQDVINLLLKKGLMSRLAAGGKAVFAKSVSDELGKVITPLTLARLARGGVSPDALVELIIANDAYKISTRGRAFDQAFWDKLRDALKDQLRADADFFKKNWRGELDRIIAEIEGESAETSDTAGAEEDDGFDFGDEPVGPEGIDASEYDDPEATTGDKDDLWMLWYADDVSFKPFVISTVADFEADTPHNSREGWGNTDDPVKKVPISPYYETREEAVEHLRDVISNVHRLSGGIYGGMLMCDYQGEEHTLDEVHEAQDWE